MAISPINPFNQAMQIKPTQAIAAGETKSAGKELFQAVQNKNPFQGSTVGVNSNIGVGDSMNVAAQAGKQPGIGRTLAFA